MASIILSQVGATVGSALLPNMTLFGQTLSGAALGQFAGQLIGQAIDASLAPPIEGPRIRSLHMMGSQEGSGLPLVYGRMRVGGQVIWASRFREDRRERSGGKSGPRYTEYNYSISIAVALCQGPITRVDRIWANGENLPRADINHRLYPGGEAQLPDPLIEAIEGAGNAPAYRGCAYIVFEDLPLGRFGNRVPQLSFEIIRAGAPRSGQLRQSVRGVNIIPASGEFVYASQVIRERQFPGIERALNMNNNSGEADFLLSVDQLRNDLPAATSAALTVAWFGNDIRALHCRLRPGVETRTRRTVPYDWRVGKTGRDEAHLISGDEHSVNYGGTPADRAVLEGIAALKAAGVAVTLSPFILMDIPQDNTLPGPDGVRTQPAFPWRGRITSAMDGTAQARRDIETFVGRDGAFGFRHFILHHARLAAKAGGVEALLIGSEMIGLTRIRDEAGRFPFIEALIKIAREAKAIVGPLVKISYAADWTEYGAYVPGKGSRDVLFPLDALWASPDIDFVGIDWYPPVGDWRDGTDHLDARAGYASADDPAYLKANMQGGEAYDWYYASAADRLAQKRTPIGDTAHGEDWIFRQKDIVGWWNNSHYDRPRGRRAARATRWRPGMKPVRLVELGYPAIDRGGNSPNLFFDPKSSENAFPPFSTGARDDLYQRRALSAALSYWSAQVCIEHILVWAWDGRPWPYYPVLDTVWTDGPNWGRGHWLNGRTGLIELPEIIADLAQKAGVAVNISALTGFVEGFVIEGITGLRQAIAPLQAAFGLTCIEREGVLVFEHQHDGPVLTLAPDTLTETGLTETRTLLDKQPDRLSLTHISNNNTYEPAIVEARNANAKTNYTLRLNMPLVMGKARALALAESLLQNALSVQSASLSLGPAGLGIKAGALVRVANGPVWRVTHIHDKGLERTLELASPAGIKAPVRAVQPGESKAVDAFVPATPELIMIDGPPLPGMADNVPLVAVAADPWPGRVEVTCGSDLAALTMRAQFDRPCGIGRITGRVWRGVTGRWDEASTIRVFMPGETLSSAEAIAVLNGTNRMYVENNRGWELLGWREANLEQTGIWVLRGLLRGLSGTQVGRITPGKRAVLADERLQAAVWSGDETGLERIWQANGGDAHNLVFANTSALPPRPAHLKIELRDKHWHLKWTKRSHAIKDSWIFPEAENSGRFGITIGHHTGKPTQMIIDTTHAVIPDDNVLYIGVQEMDSADGRPGHVAFQFVSRPGG